MFYDSMYQKLSLNSDALSAYQSSGTITNISVIASNSASQQEVIAWDCVLSFCAKSYNASVSVNFLHETPVDVFDELKSTINYKDVGAYDDTITFDFPSIHLGANNNVKQTFILDPLAVLSLRSNIGATLKGDTSLGDLVDDPGPYPFTSGIENGFYYNGIDNLEKTISNIADAMTDVIRMNSALHVKGTAFTMETCIHVQWLWLLLPFTMLVLAAVLLGLTVSRTKKSDIPSWQSSALAVMEHGVNMYLYEDNGSGHFNEANGDMAAAEREG
jgi:hypothetical protein